MNELENDKILIPERNHQFRFLDYISASNEERVSLPSGWATRIFGIELSATDNVAEISFEEEITQEILSLWSAGSVLGFIVDLTPGAFEFENGTQISRFALHVRSMKSRSIKGSLKPG